MCWNFSTATEANTCSARTAQLSKPSSLTDTQVTRANLTVTSLRCNAVASAFRFSPFLVTFFNKDRNKTLAEDNLIAFASLYSKILLFSS